MSNSVDTSTRRSSQESDSPIFLSRVLILRQNAIAAFSNPVSLAMICLVGFVLSGGKASASDYLVGGRQRSEWRFFDNGIQPMDNWRLPEFDDSRWNTGVGPFGYGDRRIRETVDYGPDENRKFITTYFRHRFQVMKRPANRCVLLLCVDDGAVVYLNGRELLRQHMPSGKIDFLTTANVIVDGSEESEYSRFEFDSSLLREGSNLLAAEVHQAYPESSDLRFDLALRQARVDIPTNITNAARVVKTVTAMYRNNHEIPAGTSVPDGFVDGGRSMRIDDHGRLTSRREIVVVDRKNDPHLRLHLALASSDEIRSLPEQKRAQYLARYVDRQLSPDEGRGWSQLETSLMESEFESRGIYLGLATAGFDGNVCRHRALLFKLMADAAGLRVALVRGGLGGDGDAPSAHAWNELWVDQKRYIVDTMNPRPAYAFVADDSARARHYFTVDDRPMYQD